MKVRRICNFDSVCRMFWQTLSLFISCFAKIDTVCGAGAQTLTSPRQLLPT